MFNKLCNAGAANDEEGGRYIPPIFWAAAGSCFLGFLLLSKSQVWQAEPCGSRPRMAGARGTNTYQTGPHGGRPRSWRRGLAAVV